METFTEYRARIAQEKLLLESPMIAHSNTPAVLNAGSRAIQDHINTNHNKSTHISGDVFHLVHDSGSDVYYHLVGNKPNELSFISKDIQVGVSKGVNGDVSHIHKMMRHHVDTHGVLNSSNSNTYGSRKLWVDFIKNNKDLKFHAIHDSGNKTKLDHKNIDQERDKLWGDAPHFRNVTIRAEK